MYACMYIYVYICIYIYNETAEAVSASNQHLLLGAADRKEAPRNDF